MNREKSNPVARQTFPEPLDFSTVRKLLECLARCQMEPGYELGRMRDTARSTATTVPSTYSWGDQVFIRSPAAMRSLARCCRSEKARRRSAANASTSPHGKMKDGSTGAIRSRLAPAWSLVAAMQPHSIASLTTSPKGSYSEGRTSRSAAV